MQRRNFTYIYDIFCCIYKLTIYYTIAWFNFLCYIKQQNCQKIIFKQFVNRNRTRDVGIECKDHNHYTNLLSQQLCSGILKYIEREILNINTYILLYLKMTQRAKFLWVPYALNVSLHDDVIVVCSPSLGCDRVNICLSTYI